MPKLLMMPNDIHMVLSSGGGLRIESSSKTADALASYAASAKRGGARLVIVVNSMLAAGDMAMIAANGGGRVEFDLIDW